LDDNEKRGTALAPDCDDGRLGFLKAGAMRLFEGAKNERAMKGVDLRDRFTE